MASYTTFIQSLFKTRNVIFWGTKFGLRYKHKSVDVGITQNFGAFGFFLVITRHFSRFV